MNVRPPTIIVSGPEALAEFRQGLTGQRILDLLDEADGRLLVTLAVGVGKTEAMVETITHALGCAGEVPLILVLAPRRDILAEIRDRLPQGTRHVVLEPRPRRRCGALDASWTRFEAAGCGLLAKEEVCAVCPRKAGCRWPTQFHRDHLKDVDVVLATQHHLVLNPRFVADLRSRAVGRDVLVLVDESDLLLKAVRRSMRRGDLDGFIAVQEQVLAETGTPTTSQTRWLELSRLIAEAPTGDLQQGDWGFPRPIREWSLAIQRAGVAIVGPGFRFLGHELDHFARSDPASRERTAAGDVEFACPTDLGDRFAIFSGSIARGLARYRLDPDHRRPGLSSPFEHYRFEHPGTRWYNLRSIAGADKYFARNSAAILSFYASKVAANIRAGRRTLLIAKKRLVPHCAAGLAERLRDLGVGPVRVVTEGWDAADLDDPRTLPLINYGVSGINRFEGHDCAYCLTGYYASAAPIAAAVHDLDPSDERSTIRLVFAGDPPRRRAVMDRPDDRETILPRVTEWVLQQKEDDVVIQAVGRVRPFTKPREVITFQVGDLPDVRYAREFRTLTEARAHFGVPTRRQSAAEARAADAHRLKVLGLTRPMIAKAIGVSLASVKRYLRQPGAHEPFSNIK